MSLFSGLFSDSGEPFGMPRGTVRGIIALSATLSLVYMWVTAQPVSDPQLAITTLIIGNYFGNRGATPPAAPEPPLPAPYVPADNEE